MTGDIFLKSSHIYLNKEIVERIFDKIHYAYVVYSKNQDKILITPVSSVWFAKMFQPSQFLLKQRNLKGDMTLAIREILIDNDLDMTDRNLTYEFIEKTNLIKVKI